MKNKNNISWFSIIEVMIAIFIFAMWMASIFMVLSSSMNIDTLNKNQIIAANLAREEIEIIRNIRDNNYATYHKYNWIPWKPYFPVDSDNYFLTWTYYKIENDFSSANYPFKIDNLGNQSFTNDSKQDFVDWKFNDYKLCIKKDTNIYSYICNSDDKEIKFYRYLYLDELKKWDWSVVNNAMKVKSKVIWYSKWYHEFEINTILADFNRL